MQGKITSDLSFCLAENGFSLDELVFKLKELFENKAFSELLRLILQLTQLPQAKKGGGGRVKP